MQLHGITTEGKLIPLKSNNDGLLLVETDNSVSTAVDTTNISLGTDGATPPTIVGTGVRGWLRGCFEKLTTLASSILSLESKTPNGNELFFAIARGEITGYTSGNKAGRNTDVDIGTEDVISQGGLYVPPTVARIHNLASSSVSDTSAGVGARTISITGLLADLSEVTETLTLNGTTAVPTVNAYIFINRIMVSTAGTSGTNVGAVTATAQTDLTVSAVVLAGDGQAALGVYQVPLNKTMYLFNLTAGARLAGGGAGTVIVQIMTRTLGGAWTKRQTLHLNTTGNNSVTREYQSPLKLLAGTMVKVQVTSDTNNMDVTCAFDYVVVAP